MSPPATFKSTKASISETCWFRCWSRIEALGFLVKGLVHEQTRGVATSRVARPTGQHPHPGERERREAEIAERRDADGPSEFMEQMGFSWPRRDPGASYPQMEGSGVSNQSPGFEGQKGCERSVCGKPLRGNMYLLQCEDLEAAIEEAL